jgi:hypothetical protein
MNELGFAVSPDMRLHSKIPLIALLGLVHLGIALFVFVLNRGRRIDKRGIDDRTRADLHALRLQVLTDGRKQLFTQIMGFQQVTKFAHRGLIGRRFMPKINTHKRPHRAAVVQCFFHRRIGEVKPVLQKVYSQHPLNPHRRAAGTVPFGVYQLNQPAQLSPRHDPLHLRQEDLAPRRLAIPLKIM